MLRLLSCLAVALASAAASAQPLAVRADTLYTAAGPAIAGGVVVVEDGRIAAVGPAASTPIPAGARVLEAVVVTPGLVDVRATVGLSGLLNQPQDQDALDTGGPLQPSLRAMDAYNARDPLVGWLLRFGVTTVHTGHAAGALAAGQTTVVKTAYDTIDEALVDSTVMMAMTVGPSIRRRFDSPGTRSRAIAEIRRALHDGLAYEAKRAAAEEPPPRDLDKEALADVATGRMPALITAHTAVDIQAALRLAREFPEMRMVLDGAAEAPLVLDAIRAAGVPVSLHATMVRPSGEMESAAFTTAGVLARAGVPFAIQSGYEAYVPKTRVVLFEAATALGYGLPRDAALRAITLDAARIIGQDARVGSIEPGKDADLVLFDGDPFEVTTHVCAVVVDGRVASEGCY